MARRHNKKNRAKKVYIQLHAPYRTYGSIKNALAANPDTQKGDWHRFDSTGEYERYIQLLEYQRDGEISDLIPHPMTIEIAPQLKLPKNALRPKLRTRQRRVYTPDFSYKINEGQPDEITVFEDYKGYKANAYDSLRHDVFMRSLISDYGWQPDAFHFKVVTKTHANPMDE